MVPGFFADVSECSITRTELHFRALFAEARPYLLERTYSITHMVQNFATPANIVSLQT